MILVSIAGFGFLAALGVGTSTAAAETCGTWVVSPSMANLASDQVSEASGLAVGHVTDGVAWVHDDAGGEAVLVAFDEDGTDLGAVVVSMSTHEDWEDLAAGPCEAAADGTKEVCACLYVADIGNNDGDREGGTVWRVPEPVPPGSGEVGATEPATGISFSWPDGAPDAEGLVVHPSGEIGIITKSEDGPATVYLLSEDGTLAALGVLDLEAMGATEAAVTAADISRDGEWMVVATDADLVVLHAPGATDLLDLLGGEVQVLDGVVDDTMEAVGWRAEGRALWMVGDGPHPTLWQFQCTDGQGDAGPVLAACPEDGGGCGCATRRLRRGDVAWFCLLALGFAGSRRRQR